jgi:fido (protein-threonine AMPylation protein)
MLHRQVFQPAGLWFAGRMRQPGEPGVTYGHGPHERDGLLAEQIEPELDRLYDGVIAGVDWENLSHWQVARRAASFLEWFFRIHPFHDGNGRVGRLMVRALLYRTQFQVIDAFPDESTQDGTAWRTRYRKGLEHAHRHACPTEADQYRIEGGRRVDPLSKLATALHECIEPRPVQDHEHVPPEWIRVVRLRKTAARAEAQVSEPDKDEAN